MEHRACNANGIVKKVGWSIEHVTLMALWKWCHKIIPSIIPWDLRRWCDEVQMERPFCIDCFSKHAFLLFVFWCFIENIREMKTKFTVWNSKCESRISPYLFQCRSCISHLRDSHNAKLHTGLLPLASLQNLFSKYCYSHYLRIINTKLRMNSGIWMKCLHSIHKGCIYSICWWYWSHLLGE